MWNPNMRTLRELFCKLVLAGHQGEQDWGRGWGRERGGGGVGRGHGLTILRPSKDVAVRWCHTHFHPVGFSNMPCSHQSIDHELWMIDVCWNAACPAHMSFSNAAMHKWPTPNWCQSPRNAAQYPQASTEQAKYLHHEQQNELLVNKAEHTASNPVLQYR